ncbi:hypothetical protein ZIOFF_028596 [Zingiber officinale]|uniref:Protein kinase domain-containing protein n=1 Tax=Zingiber officinale TaxID=94328 RepID=A0A8J5GVB6_ZINOF|nr:hypothetical protein ZIOFF_028596 [Zingiber officinale]
MGRNGSVRRSYSVSPNDYKLLEEVGYGASATVYRANHLPTNEFVAVKRLDLDRCNSNLDDIRREAQIMSLIDHPNVIRAYCSFVVERYLWVVMPFMAGGSCLHLMKIRYPDGFEEPIICSILKETLRALEYLHQHGHIHRDVKAGNILLDSSGVVKLGDFGVSACLFDKGDRQRSRNTFVGTPCWMAPEVLQPGSGYDFKADIWSFGITALELAHGHAPFSKYPPMKVLLMTLQNAPPGLDYDRDKKFSKVLKVPFDNGYLYQTKRPTAEKLLKHSFFKHAKPPEISLKSILIDLPPLWDRVKALQLDDAAQLALKKMPSSEQEALSQVGATFGDNESVSATIAAAIPSTKILVQESNLLKTLTGHSYPVNHERPRSSELQSFLEVKNSVTRYEVVLLKVVKSARFARLSVKRSKAQPLRFRELGSARGASSSALEKRKQSSAQTSLVNEEEINLDNETEEEDTDGYKSSDGTDDIDLENEDEEDDYFDI